MKPRGQSLFDDVFAGDVRGARGAVASLGAGDELSPAWACALRAALESAEPGTVDPVTVQELEALPDGEPGLMCAVRETGRSALLRMDARELTALVELGRCKASRSEEDQVQCQLVAAYLAWLSGDGGVDAAGLMDLSMRASRLGMAVEVVEATAMGAAAYLREGDAASALRGARRASRMARTESLPQPEYLANLVLARVRRVLGSPHLSARILTALFRVVPATWHPWLGWELVLATGSAPERDVANQLPSELASASLRRFFKTIRSLDGASIAAARAGLEEAASVHGDHRLDVAGLLAVVDPTVEPDWDRLVAVQPWARGESPVVPLGLHAASYVGGDPREALACLVSGPGRPSRRFLRLAHLLVAQTQSVRVIEPSQRANARVDRALAALVARHGEVLTHVELFGAIYDFAYVDNVHRSVLSVLVHRVRQHLGDAGEITASPEGYRLDLHEAVLVVDPRCGAGIEDHLLRVLAEEEGCGARELAKRLGVSLRSVQNALRELVDEGVCVVSKEGKRVRYRVEDTTFSEPTTHHALEV